MCSLTIALRSLALSSPNDQRMIDVLFSMFFIVFYRLRTHKSYSSWLRNMEQMCVQRSRTVGIRFGWLPGHINYDIDPKLDPFSSNKMGCQKKTVRLPEGFPNFFGLQRFGTGQQPSSVQGLALLGAQSREVVRLALGSRARHGKALEATGFVVSCVAFLFEGVLLIICLVNVCWMLI